jgi:hypothetical protein
MATIIVSDVFHTGSPDSPLWEFKHGANNFRRGDLNGLRDIKRRASRHTLIHRDSFSNATPKMTLQPPPPPPPGAPMESTMPDPVEARLSMLEFNLQDVYARLARSEDAYANLSAKCQMLSEGLARCHYVSFVKLSCVAITNPKSVEWRALVSIARNGT